MLGIPHRHVFVPVCVCFCLCLCLTLPAALAQEAPDSEVRKDSLRLLEVTGASEMGTQMGMMMAQQILADRSAELTRQQQQVIIEELQKLFEERFDSALEEIAGVYEKHLTHDEIRQLIAFYETPLGRKTIQVLPQIMQESMVIGQRWGAQLGPEIAKRIEARLEAMESGGEG